MDCRLIADRHGAGGYFIHFAAAFLVPANALRRDLGNRRTNLDPIEVAFLKQKYGISLRHLIPRAASLRIIDPDTLSEWMAAGKEEGWADMEAACGECPTEAPQRLIRLAHRFEIEKMYTEDRTEALLTMPWLD